MTHLPECYKEGSTDSCICDELRACEQRVLDAAQEAVEHAHQRDSLAVRSQTEWGVEIALAAIDALRGEPNG